MTTKSKLTWVAERMARLRRTVQRMLVTFEGSTIRMAMRPSVRRI